MTDLDKGFWLLNSFNVENKYKLLHWIITIEQEIFCNTLRNIHSHGCIHNSLFFFLSLTLHGHTVCKSLCTTAKSLVAFWNSFWDDFGKKLWIISHREPSLSLYFCSQNRYILHELGSTSLNKSQLCFQPYVHYLQWNVQQIQKSRRMEWSYSENP